MLMMVWLGGGNKMPALKFLKMMSYFPLLPLPDNWIKQIAIYSGEGGENAYRTFDVIIKTYNTQEC